MRRSAAIILLLIAACGGGSSGLTPDNASIVATILDGSKADQVQTLAEVLRADEQVVDAVAADVGKGTFLARFKDGSTLDQRKAVFNRLASSGLFSSIQCSTCSEHR